MNNITRYTMCARSQGVLYTQRPTAAELTVRKWLSQRLNGDDTTVEGCEAFSAEGERG